MIVLLAAGAAVTFFGLLAVLFGLPISDTSFGNALLISGIVVGCTGMLILAMWVLGRQLERIADALSPASTDAGMVSEADYPEPPTFNPVAAPAALSFPDPQPPPLPPPARPPERDSRDFFAAIRSEAGIPNPVTPLPPLVATPSPSQPISPSPVPELTDAAPDSAAVPERPRRNLLFQTRRRDKSETTAMAEASAAAATPFAAAVVASSVPPLDFPKRTTELTKPSFDDAWSGGVAPPLPAPAVPPSAPSPVPAPPPPAPRLREPERKPPEKPRVAPISVIKSGIVDGMAYSLYSDGSIEAQMPTEGLLRFSSLDALRDYLEQRL